MKFDVYYPFLKPKLNPDDPDVWCPGTRSKRMTIDEIINLMNQPGVVQITKAIRSGFKEKKMQLPAVCWHGLSLTGKRRNSDCIPTQFVMVDIDHCKDPRGSWQAIWRDYEKLDKKIVWLVLAHITPSGQGLRLVFRAVIDKPTIVEHLVYLDSLFKFGQYGDFDKACKDLARLSFLPCADQNLLFIDRDYLNTLDDEPKGPIMGANSVEKKPVEAVKDLVVEAEGFFDSNTVSFTDEEREKYEKYDFRGTPMKIVIEKYVEVNGTPGTGEIHNFYNDMVKNFRCICSNDKKALLYLLPRFGHSIDECWSQIKSICRSNTLSRLPKSFYFFLKDNGFYKPRGTYAEDMKDYMMEEKEEKIVMPPYLPPVFREFVGTAPDDFVVPAVNALLPILGTLTSYVRAIYPYDNREHSTSFFSVIYAPAGSGKGFVERFLDILFEDLKLRDLVQSERENVYLRILQRKGANDKAPDMPHVSLRIIPPKNSEAEFLQKQRDNQGYHMFTYAAEMDSWAKGVRAAGGNKDDMIRIAWDNGEYGQQFKSANTFKGTVRLYWNVLITGTIAQVENYFKNVENGLVTRCSFCSIENQEFREAPRWGKISKRGIDVVHAFMSRCDANTYETPCNINPMDVVLVKDDDFDNEIDWRFKFRQHKTIDMSWIMPTIDKFHNEQMKLAALDMDRARDTFRRRVGVRGFRLAMICYCLWERPRQSDLEKCIPFIEWWMHADLENMLKLWGSRYNEQTDETPHITQRLLYDALGDDFDRNDVYVLCTKQGIRTPVRRIIFEWKKLGYVEQLSKEQFRKKGAKKGGK